jgi:hypothetical protein
MERTELTRSSRILLSSRIGWVPGVDWFGTPRHRRRRSAGQVFDALGRRRRPQRGSCYSVLVGRRKGGEGACTWTWGAGGSRGYAHPGAVGWHVGPRCRVGPVGLRGSLFFFSCQGTTLWGPCGWFGRGGSVRSRDPPLVPAAALGERSGFRRA